MLLTSAEHGTPNGTGKRECGLTWPVRDFGMNKFLSLYYRTSKPFDMNSTSGNKKRWIWIIVILLSHHRNCCSNSPYINYRKCYFFIFSKISWLWFQGFSNTVFINIITYYSKYYLWYWGHYYLLKKLYSRYLKLYKRIRIFFILFQHIYSGNKYLQL